MTLATRCPACGTVFRVVPDQLRVSEGWVRCGRCSEAFNALEAMVDWPQARPAPSAPPSTDRLVPEPAADTPAPAESRGESRDEHAAAPDSPPGPGTEATMAAAGMPGAPVEPPPVDVPAGVEVVASDGALDTHWVPPVGESPPGDDRLEPSFDAGGTAESPAATTPVIPPAAAAAAPADAAATAAAADEAPVEPPPAPSFVLQAERAARWRRPGVRLALGLASLLAGLGLAAQITHAFRDRIAASSPALRPLLQQACATLGCRVGEYRQIDALSVESSALVRMDGAPVYRLAVTLRNRAAIEVAAPALDLAITDAQGRQIARRVLTMADLNLPLRSLRPGTELPIQAPLGIDGAVSGYTVEIFYP